MEQATYHLGIDFNNDGLVTAEYGVLFNGSTTLGNCGDDSSLEDIQAGDLDVGIWARPDSFGETSLGCMINKGANASKGWLLRISTAAGLGANIEALTLDAVSTSGPDEFSADGQWHFYTMTYANAGDRKIYLAIDGVWVVSYGTQQAAQGTIISDAGEDLMIGSYSGGTCTWDGGLGWAAIYKDAPWPGPYLRGEDFTPPVLPPTPFDEGLAECWVFGEQTGAIAGAMLEGANDCALSNHLWTVGWESPEVCSDDFVSATISRGFSDPLSRVAQVSRAMIVANNIDRQYSPVLQSNVRPGRPVRLDMTYNAVTETLFQGVIGDILPTSGEWGQRRVAFSCIDDMALIDAVEAKIALAVDVTADEIIEAVTDTIPTLLAPNYEVGINVFDTSADRWLHDPTGSFGKFNRLSYEQGAASGKIMDAVMADWGRFFIAKNGVPTFYNRHHEILEETTSLTLTTPMELSYRMAIATIYNMVEIKCHPRNIAVTREVVWSLITDQAPRVIRYKTLRMDCKFGDPTNAAITIGGKDCIIPVAYTDYTATSDELGSGDDKTAQIGMVATFYGDRATLDITNNDPNDVYLQTLQIRGYAVRSEGDWTAFTENVASQGLYGARRLRLNAVLISRPYQAERLAEHLLEAFEAPADEITGVMFNANRDAASMIAARDLELIDRVSLTEAQTGLSTYLGHIYKLEHRIGEDGVSHMVSMDLQTVFDLGLGNDPFRLETDPPGGGSALNSGDVLIY